MFHLDGAEGAAELVRELEEVEAMEGLSDPPPISELRDLIELKRKELVSITAKTRQLKAEIAVFEEALRARVSPDSEQSFKSFLEFLSERDELAFKQISTARVAYFNDSTLRVKAGKSEHSNWLLLRELVEGHLAEFSGHAMALEINYE